MIFGLLQAIKLNISFAKCSYRNRFLKRNCQRRALRPTRTWPVWRKNSVEDTWNSSRNCWLYEFQTPNFFADFWLGMPCFFFFLPLLSCELHASQELERYVFLRVFMLQSIPSSMVVVLMRRSVRKVTFVIIFVSQKGLHGTISDQRF